MAELIDLGSIDFFFGDLAVVSQSPPGIGPRQHSCWIDFEPEMPGVDVLLSFVSFD